MAECNLSVSDAADLQGVTPPAARKWLGRYLAGGEAAPADASSRLAHSPRSIEPAKALLIVQLRHRRMLQSSITRSVGVSPSMVSQVLARAGLSKLSDLVPAEPVVRYEREAPGELLHIDAKKLGRIVRPSHRVTGNRRDSVEGAGWETLFVAIDDHARLAFTTMHPDEKQAQAVLFLKNAVAYYAAMGVTVQRLLTDNGPAFRSREFRQACEGWASSTVSPGPTGRRPTARPSASSSRPCESGRTVGRTRTRPSALLRWRIGNTATTATDRMAASVASRRSPDSALHDTTS